MDRQRGAVPRSGAVSSGQDIGAMYEKYKDALYRFARSMLRGDQQHQAEDVVQEAVISVWRNPPEDVVSWEGLFVQAVRWKIYDLWKSAAYQRESTTLDGVVRVDAERHVDDPGSDPAMLMEETREREAAVVRVREAMATLAAEDLEAAYVYRQVKEAERTSGEVAAEMGVSASRVRQHVMRARARLMEILDTSGGGL